MMAHADSPRQPLAVLVSNFGYAPPPTCYRKMSGDPVTKRRKIELAEPATTSLLSRKLGIAANDHVAPAKRPKAPKKKPQTVTAVATAAYQPPDAEITIDTSSKLPTRENDSKPPRKKKRVQKSNVTFAEPPPPPLYTPIKASKQADTQNFLFGTSSQLAAPDSPSFIRQMQAAIAQSELQPATQAMPVSPAKKSSLTVPTAPHGTSLAVGQAVRELWRSAARDFNDGLLRENSGLRPGAKNARSHPKVSTSRNIITVSEPSVNVNTAEKNANAPHDSFIDIDDISDHEPPQHTPSPPRRKASASPRPPQPLVFDITSSSPPPFTEKDPPPKSPPKLLLEKAVKTVPGKALLKETATAKLAKKRASKRPAVDEPAIEPPAIEVAHAQLPAFEQPPIAVPAAIVLSETATFDNVPPKPTGLAKNAKISFTDPQWASIRATLFPQITSTIKTAPRSTDPEKPSWHHKILLYDPIVLEDLTAWLNEQNMRISVERIKAKTVAKGRKKKAAAAAELESPAEEEAPKTKKGRKKRASTEPELPAGGATELPTETVEEELQPWMVQKWCEEKSICCLWKEGLRGGVRSRY